jgi:hypothetical protein
MRTPRHYDCIILNLPCLEAFDPRTAKVMKWSDSADNNGGAVAGKFVTLVDDCRKFVTFTCGSGFNFRIGVWGSSEKEESSNYK